MPQIANHSSYPHLMAALNIPEPRALREISLSEEGGWPRSGNSARALQNSLPARRTISGARLLHHISPQEPRPVGPRPGGVLPDALGSLPVASFPAGQVTSELLLRPALRTAPYGRNGRQAATRQAGATPGGGRFKNRQATECNCLEGRFHESNLRAGVAGCWR